VGLAIKDGGKERKERMGEDSRIQADNPYIKGGEGCPSSPPLRSRHDDCGASKIKEEGVTKELRMSLEVRPRIHRGRCFQVLTHQKLKWKGQGLEGMVCSTVRGGLRRKERAG